MANISKSIGSLAGWVSRGFKSPLQYRISKKRSVAPIPGQAAQFEYAKESAIITKQELFHEGFTRSLQQIDKAPSSFFKKGETVCIPDVHGDYILLIQLLYKHDLLDKNLNLKKDFNYIFLGDIYDKEEESDVVDAWINDQIQNGINIKRLVGNHEIMFACRNSDGDCIYTPAEDVQRDKRNGYQITEEILRQMSNGNLVAAASHIDLKTGRLVLDSHSFTTDEDFRYAGVGLGDINGYVDAANDQLIKVARESLERFKFNQESNFSGWRAWSDIYEPFENNFLFNVRGKEPGSRVRTSPLNRRPLSSSGNRNIGNLDHFNLPENVVQYIGHTPVHFLDAESGEDNCCPVALSSAGSKNSFVVFNDLALGYSNTPDIATLSMNPKLSEKLL